MVPAIRRVQRLHQPRYGCQACESAVVQAKARPRPIDSGLPTAALLVHVATMKVAWHLLNRQIEILAGQGDEVKPGGGCYVIPDKSAEFRGF